jgi:mRNA interferase MazF
MTACSRGEVVLVNFIFADESGGKRRPAVILSSERYNKGRDEAVIAAITSNIGRILEGDHLIADWQGAGLLFPSVSTGIIRTIKAAMVDRKLGSMGSRDMEAIDSKLRLILDLS